MNRCSIKPALLLTLSAASAILSGNCGAQTGSLMGKGDSILSARAASSPKSGWTRVIVRLDGDLTPMRERQFKRLGADVYRHLDIIHSIALSLPSRNLTRLSALPFVRHLSSDGEVKKFDTFTVGSSDANMAWQAPYNLNGSGVTVAILDSGIHPLLDLSVPGLLGTGLLSNSRIVRSVNYVPGTTSTDDACGHGTHVAGIVAGNGSSSSGLLCYKTYYGIAAKAQLISVRVLDQIGQGTVSQVVAGVQWCVANRSKYAIKVLNLSLGHPVGESYITDPLCQAVESAWKAGIVVVCAAGNEGRLNSANLPGLDNEGWGTAYGSVQCPGNDPYVITVGASKSTTGDRTGDKIATYSSRGPSRVDLILKPDIMAPGNQVISTLAAGSYLDTAYSGSNQIPWSDYAVSLLGGNSNKYFRLSGTSMAAPVVAGAAALMLQAQPNLTPDTVKARLMFSADKWTQADGSTDPCTYGAGYVNVPSALKSTVVATQYAMSPNLVEDDQGNVYINMDRAIWGSRAIWGTNVTDFRAVWGTRAIWGSSLNLLNASRAIWGTSVWSDRAIWGTASTAVDLSSRAIQGE